MKILLSSAKTMKFDKKFEFSTKYLPKFIKRSEKIAIFIKKLEKPEIKKLFKISDNLTDEVFENYKKWNLNYENVKFSKALFSYNGAVFDKINPEKFSKEELKFAENSVRIISGLYGILEPSDLIMPYRLEIGLKLEIGNHKNLYSFWKETLTKHLANDLEKDKSPIILNLASNEFSKVINFKKINYKIYTPTFKEEKNGKLKTVAFFAKQARGAMTNFIIKNKIENIENLKVFTWNGYKFNFHDETKNILLFLKK